MKIEQWLCHQIDFTSADHYDDPFMDVAFSVIFTHESGETLVRPGFWMGGDHFAVRFAPTKTGVWTWKSTCANRADAGLHNVTGTLACVPYTGELAIYQHGFLKVSDNHRYFTYADGTPFFYLGDTHWLMIREHFDDSNVEGVDSQFKFMVDLRLTEGFTVYQSEPIGSNLHVKFSENSLKMLNENIDRKFKYIADAGLVHANAELFFAKDIMSRDLTPEYLNKLTVMWAARYGAYPVLWTIAQEVDPDHYGHTDVTKWFIVAEQLYLNDCYHHPLTGHMCNDAKCHPNNTTFGKKYYHDWFGMQAQGASRKAFQEFYDYEITKPILNYETGYERLWSTENSSVDVAYRSMFAGSCGYGYGGHGVWNGNNSPEEWMNYGGYTRWFEGSMQLGARRLWFFKWFMEALPWQDLVPRFENTDYWEKNAYGVLTAWDDHTLLLFDFSVNKDQYTLKQLSDVPYTLFRLNTYTGDFVKLGELTPENGTVTLPKRDILTPCVFVLTKEPERFAELPLSIFADTTVLTYQGDKIKLNATGKAVKWAVSDEAVASIDENGVLTANGKNGLVTVTVTDMAGRTAKRQFLAVRQKTDAPVGKPEKITLAPFLHVRRLTEAILPEGYADMTLVPCFEPENYWDQDCRLIVTDEDGNISNKASVNDAYILTPLCNATLYVQAVHPTGVKSDQLKITVTGHGEPSLLLNADCTCDDYHEFYDVRCLPQRAVNGNVNHFTGWCSEKKCSFADPAKLFITPKAPVEMNQIDLYTTDLEYMLQAFDLVITAPDGSETVVGSVRKNKQTKLSFSFEKVLAAKVTVVCFEGDGDGNARVDQLNAYLEERP